MKILKKKTIHLILKLQKKKSTEWSRETPWQKVKTKHGKPVDPRGEVTHMSDIARRKSEKLKESGMSEVDLLLQEIARGNVDIMEIYVNPKTNVEMFVQEQLHEKAAEVAREQHMDLEGDIDDILQRIQRELEVEYGTDDNMDIEMEGAIGKAVGTVAGMALAPEVPGSGMIGGMIGDKIGDKIANETVGGGNWLEESQMFAHLDEATKQAATGVVNDIAQNIKNVEPAPVAGYESKTAQLLSKVKDEKVKAELQKLVDQGFRNTTLQTVIMSILMAILNRIIVGQGIHAGLSGYVITMIIETILPAVGAMAYSLMQGDSLKSAFKNAVLGGGLGLGAAAATGLVAETDAAGALSYEDMTEDNLDAIAKKHGMEFKRSTYGANMSHPTKGKIDINRYGEWRHYPAGSNTGKVYGDNSQNFRDLDKHLASLKEGTALTGQYGHSGKLKPVEAIDQDMMERIKFLAGITK
jgi:hypothetical protein